MKYATSLIVNEELQYAAVKKRRIEGKGKPREKPAPKPKDLLVEAEAFRKEARATKSETLRRLCMKKADELTMQCVSSSEESIDSDSVRIESDFRRNEEIIRERLRMKKDDLDVQLKVGNAMILKDKVDKMNAGEEYAFRTRNITPDDTKTTTRAIDGEEETTVIKTAAEKINEWSTPVEKLALTRPMCAPEPYCEEKEDEIHPKPAAIAPSPVALTSRSVQPQKISDRNVEPQKSKVQSTQLISVREERELALAAKLEELVRMKVRSISDGRKLDKENFKKGLVTCYEQKARNCGLKSHAFF
jgi:hypothetical protein